MVYRPIIPDLDDRRAYAALVLTLIRNDQERRRLLAVLADASSKDVVNIARELERTGKPGLEYLYDVASAQSAEATCRAWANGQQIDWRVAEYIFRALLAATTERVKVVLGICRPLTRGQSLPADEQA